jgi:two-component system, NtrC family, sensor histidine kinase KinB
MASAHKNTPVSSDPAATAVAPNDALLAGAAGAADVPNPEDLLQEYNELRERYQRTTNALASAAHDLKTPLSILNGYVEILHSEKLGSLNEKQHEILRDMQSSGKRLQQFIQDFLTFSAIETGGLRLQFAPGDINECLSDVCRLWSNRFQQKGIALYFLANDKLPVFPLDVPKLERVVSNFLENAFKFTPQGGTVWLHAEPHMWDRRTAALPSSAERRRQNLSQPNAVKISVADTGPGIPAEFHLEVFDDFFRLPSSEATEGMGLGLAIARRLVNGMGGKVWVESDPAGGCKFSFLLPFKPAPYKSVPDKPAPKKPVAAGTSGKGKAR